VKGEDGIEEEGMSIKQLIKRNRKMMVSLWILGLHRKETKSKLERTEKKIERIIGGPLKLRTILGAPFKYYYYYYYYYLSK